MNKERQRLLIKLALTGAYASGRIAERNGYEDKFENEEVIDLLIEELQK